MYYGVAYYPEHWPEERWPVDAQMMQEAGINGVRMGEFAWSKIEPVEGHYDFDWLDRAITLLASHGIKTMMCTLSRTPPPWVFHKYPEIRNLRADGHASNYGHRYTVCLNSPKFIELSQRIDRAVIEHYAGNKNVIAWHIDNEIGAGNACYCETCHRKFIDYLVDKYQTIENLNACWGTHFWSFAFSSFDEVPLPVGVRFPSPSLSLEYARFQSKTNVDFAFWRYELMKKLHPEAWVTTNFQTSNATHTDIFDLGRATDIYGTNFYPTYAPEFALDYCRGDRGQVFILEQRSGQPHWMPGTQPGWMRLWAYRSIAHGACGINFFRWRTCRWGQEEYWHGVLPHSGRPNRRYQELTQMGKELQQIGLLIETTRPAPQVAVVMGYDSRWALQAVSSNEVLPPIFSYEAMDVHEEAKAYHSALMRLNVCTDALDPRMDLSRYKLVIAPRLYCIDDPTASNLRRYVEAGGVLCLTPRSGVVDQYNVMFDQPAPGPLRELAGINVDDYTSLTKPVGLQSNATGLRGLVEGTLWADEIQLAGATVLATYQEEWLTGLPAITVNQYGKGMAIYVGTVLRDSSLQALISWLCEKVGVDLGLPTPEGVCAYERRSENRRLLFLLNFSGEEQSIPLKGAWEDAFTGELTSQVYLQLADVKIYKQVV